MNRKYEVLLLLNPDLEKAELDKLIGNIEAKMGGTIVKKEDQGIRELAYTIQKARKAYYVLYFVETTSDNILLLKELISITKEIIRPMILRHEKKWPYEYKNASELKFPERKPRKEFKPRAPRPDAIAPAKTTDSKES